MTINELLALNNLTANDQIPVWDAEATGSTEPTAKITAQNFANAVKSLASLIGTGDLDATPTQGSTKAVQSGGVYTAIAQSTAKETGIARITMDQLSFTKKGSIYIASVSLPDETHSIPAGVKIVQVCKYGGGIETIPFVQTDNDGSNLNVLAIDDPGNNSYHYINVRWYK